MENPEKLITELKNNSHFLLSLTIMIYFMIDCIASSMIIHYFSYSSKQPIYYLFVPFLNFPYWASLGFPTSIEGATVALPFVLVIGGIAVFTIFMVNMVNKKEVRT